MLLEEVKPHEQIHLFDEFYLEYHPTDSSPGVLMYTLETFGDVQPVGHAHMKLYKNPNYGELYDWHLEWGIYSQSQGMSLEDGAKFGLFREWCINTLREMVEEEHGTS